MALRRLAVELLQDGSTPEVVAERLGVSCSILDRLNVHRAAIRHLQIRGASWLSVEWLPAYAPELNPVEAVWSHAKYTALANFVPDDRDHLHDAVIEAVGDTHFKQPLLQSFFHAAQLRL
jgi:putative transposase